MLLQDFIDASFIYLIINTPIAYFLTTFTYNYFPPLCVYNHHAGFVRLPLHPWGSRIGSKHLMILTKISVLQFQLVQFVMIRKSEELTIFGRIEAGPLLRSSHF